MGIRTSDRPYLRAYCSEEFKDAFEAACRKVKRTEKAVLLLLAQRFIESPADFTEIELKSGDILPAASEGGTMTDRLRQPAFHAERASAIALEITSEKPDRAISGEHQASPAKTGRRGKKGS